MDEKSVKKKNLSHVFYYNRYFGWIFLGILLFFAIFIFIFFLKELDLASIIISFSPILYLVAGFWIFKKIKVNYKKIILATDSDGIYWRASAKALNFEFIAWDTIQGLNFYKVDEGDSDSTNMVYFFELSLFNGHQLTINTREFGYKDQEIMTFYSLLKDHIETNLSDREPEDIEILLEDLGEILLYASDIPSLRPFVLHPKMQENPQEVPVNIPRMKTVEFSFKRIIFPFIISIIVPFILPITMLVLFAFLYFINKNAVLQKDTAMAILTNDYCILKINREGYFYRQLLTGSQEFFVSRFKTYSFKWEDVQSVSLKKGAYPPLSGWLREDLSPYQIIILFTDGNQVSFPLPEWDFSHFSAASLENFLHSCIVEN